MRRWLPISLLVSALPAAALAAEDPATPTPTPTATATAPEPTPARRALGGGLRRASPTPAAVVPSSIADVARESRDRKERKTSPRSLGTIDNESLRRAGATPVKTPAGRPRPAASSGAVGAVPAFVATDRDGRTEDYWRGRARSARSQVEKAESEVRRLESETRRLENDFYAWSDGNYRDQVIKPAWDKAREDLRKARADVDAATAAEAGLGEEARKAGAPPGWLR